MLGSESQNSQFLPPRLLDQLTRRRNRADQSRPGPSQFCHLLLEQLLNITADSEGHLLGSNLLESITTDRLYRFKQGNGGG